jgi:hypothetical protein
LIWSLVVLVWGWLSSPACAIPIGIGAYGGLNLPIAQQDAESGSLLGGKLRIVVHPIIALEPALTFFQQGDAEIEIAGQRTVLDGGQSTALGLNLIIGSVVPPGGLGLHGILGLASHALKQEGARDESRLALSFGPGLEVGISPGLTLSLEARLHMISLDGGGARKNVGIAGGMNYYLSN